MYQYCIAGVCPCISHTVACLSGHACVSGQREHGACEVHARVSGIRMAVWHCPVLLPARDTITSSPPSYRSIPSSSHKTRSALAPRMAPNIHLRLLSAALPCLCTGRAWMHGGKTRFTNQSRRRPCTPSCFAAVHCCTSSALPGNCH